MTTTILLFIAGLVILIFGADLLVRGASRLAAAFGVSPLVIGLTIVAIGTASPEIAVSLQAAVNGQGDLTLGNVLGSNIFNILFILGFGTYPNIDKKINVPWRNFYQSVDWKMLLFATS